MGSYVSGAVLKRTLAGLQAILTELTASDFMDRGGGCSDSRSRSCSSRPGLRSLAIRAGYNHRRQLKHLFFQTDVQKNWSNISGKLSINLLISL